GAYGIQGEGAKLIARVEGELSNVIGLPIRALREGWRAVAGEEIARAEPERPILARAYPEMMRSLVPAVFAES
ncbi:Maf family protein, partial [Candidatus Sumerlaeota bacterium]|nr:Maf family protein [Candidatus Sumerlaeota bacterium]